MSLIQNGRYKRYKSVSLPSPLLSFLVFNHGIDNFFYLKDVILSGIGSFTPPPVLRRDYFLRLPL